MLVLYRCLVLALVFTVFEAAPFYGCQHAYLKVYHDGVSCNTVSNVRISGDQTIPVRNCGIMLKCEQTSIYACIHNGAYKMCKKLSPECDKLQRMTTDLGDVLMCAY